MRIKFHGVRGSLPAPLAPKVLEARIRTLFCEFFDSGHRNKSEVTEFLATLPSERYGGFGGHTPCVEVSEGQQQLIIDAGSGIRALGAELMQGPCGQGKGEIHLFFTHFHWDHLMGLPFFTPLFVKGNRIHCYAVQPELREIVQTIFRKPYFPLQYHQLGASIEYHTLSPRQAARFGDFQVTPYQMDHPDPCWGYRIEQGGKVLSYCVDTECIRVTREQLGPDLPLYQGVDLLIFDAQYTLMEAIEKVHWGHATATLGLDIAMREGIKRVVFMHHDPSSSDDKIAAASDQAKHYYIGQLKSAARSDYKGLQPVEWSFAIEGMTLTV